MLDIMKILKFYVFKYYVTFKCYFYFSNVNINIL